MVHMELAESLELDLTLSPPVLRRIKETTPITITPISDIHRSREAPALYQKQLWNRDVITSISPLELHQKYITNQIERSEYNLAMGKMRQPKITDFLISKEPSKSRVAPSSPPASENKGDHLPEHGETSQTPQIDLPEYILKDDQTLGGELLNTTHLNSTVYMDFGNLRKSNFMSSHIILSESPMQGPAVANLKGSPITTWSESPIIEVPICITTTLESKACTPLTPTINQTQLTAAREDNISSMQTSLAEIRDTLQEIKQLMTLMLGHLTKTENSSMTPEGPARQTKEDNSTYDPGYTDYYNLSPGTINRIASLSLEELLLCVGPSAEACKNSIASKVANTKTDLTNQDLSANTGPLTQDQPVNTGSLIRGGKGPSVGKKKVTNLPKVTLPTEIAEKRKTKCKTVKFKTDHKHTGKKAKGLKFNPLFKLLDSTTSPKKKRDINNTHLNDERPKRDQRVNRAVTEGKNNTRQQNRNISQLKYTPQDDIYQMSADPVLPGGRTQSQRTKCSKEQPVSQWPPNSDSIVGIPIPVLLGNRGRHTRNKRRFRGNNEMRRRSTANQMSIGHQNFEAAPNFNEACMYQFSGGNYVQNKMI
ncbi:uncharacterized protein LOC144584285 [Pogona vitticeps]